MKSIHPYLLQFFVFVPIFLFAQTAVRAQDDELTKLLSLKDDTIKVQQLSAFAKKMVHQDKDLSRQASSALLKTSQGLQYAKGIATGYSYLAFIDLEAGKHASAANLYNKAIIFYRQAKDDRGIAKCLGNMADIYESTGQGDRAVDARLAAVAILEKLLQSSSASRKDILHSLAIQYNNFAGTYSDLFLNNAKALTYLRKAENICRQAKDTSELVDVLNNLSDLLTAMGKENEALNVGKEVLELSKATKDNFHLAAGYQSYGYALYTLDRIDSAVLMLRKALQCANVANSDYRIFKATHSLALALARKGEYKEVIQLLENAYNGVAEDGALKYKSDIEEELANAYFKTGDYKAAYQHLENRFRLKDSVIQLANNHIIAEKETKYQTAQKEKELAQKELLLQKSRQQALLGLVSSIVALLVATLIYVQYRNKRRFHESQLRALQQEKEIQLLQALMQGEEKERSRIAKDLHDGVAGMLAAVKMHLSSSGGERASAGYTKATELLDEATAEVRKTSHNLMPEVLLQHGLDRALQRYCTNISSTSLQVHYFFIGEEQRFVGSFELSVYRIVQELLNNIFKHSKATEATVQLSIQETVLSVSIEDNGIGLTKQPAQSSGMGLESLKRRISALNGNMELSTDEGGGVNAYLEFSTEGLERDSSKAEDLSHERLTT
ncbi:sensor histidine kinase [Chitinophagaceae bacterium LB-8]|uniref:Sensor histidine kinase n=1 Tax=Paraflavisolibacter caeni TaxID=2982496 RepID=A0A9X2XXS2_9BACT|nr:sensor histidine kinase [Paraflavisolibacter caeni]MCU7550711.1 sensor histidine kinase [Paraflavisolibacter caeni]